MENRENILTVAVGLNSVTTAVEFFELIDCCGKHEKDDKLSNSIDMLCNRHFDIKSNGKKYANLIIVTDDESKFNEMNLNFNLHKRNCFFGSDYGYIEDRLIQTIVNEADKFNSPFTLSIIADLTDNLGCKITRTLHRLIAEKIPRFNVFSFLIIDHPNLLSEFQLINLLESILNINEVSDLNILLNKSILNSLVDSKNSYSINQYIKSNLLSKIITDFYFNTPTPTKLLKNLIPFKYFNYARFSYNIDSDQKDCLLNMFNKENNTLGFLESERIESTVVLIRGDFDINITNQIFEAKNKKLEMGLIKVFKVSSNFDFSSLMIINSDTICNYLEIVEERLNELKKEDGVLESKTNENSISIIINNYDEYLDKIKLFVSKYKVMNTDDI